LGTEINAGWFFTDAALGVPSPGRWRERLDEPKLKPMLFNQEFTKMSTNIVQFSVLSKLVALSHLYVELGLTLPAALRAAEADLVVGAPNIERMSIRHWPA
jgi:hypothetical protein